MLGNKDFAQMISSGAALSNDGKVRFDLKQVSKWDRENEKAGKKKVDNVFKPKSKDKNDNATDYRDRALERRKDLNTEETKFEEIVSKLNADETKFLGGDLEHTHFVKGLDYALLEKIRRDTTQNLKKLQNIDNNESEMDLSVSTSVKPSSASSIGITNITKPMDSSDIKTITTLGENLKKLLFPTDSIEDVKGDASHAPTLFVQIPTIGSSSSTNIHSSYGVVKKPLTTAPVPSSSVAQVLARTRYRFELTSAGAEDEDDKPPVAIAKSMKELNSSSASDGRIYCMEGELFGKLSALFDAHGHMISRSQFNVKRKRKDGETGNAAAVPEVKVLAVPKVKDLFDSIYDDDVGPVGKYVPVGALVEEGEEQEEQVHMGAAGTGSAVAARTTTEDKTPKLSAAGIFGNNKPAAAAEPSSFGAAAMGGGGNSIMSDLSAIYGTSDMNIGTAASGSSMFGDSKSSGYKSSLPPPTASVAANAAPAPVDLMKPVRDLLAAQANKDRAQQQRLATAAGESNSNSKGVNVAQSMVIGTDAQGKALVHRDVFATTRDKVVKAGTVAGNSKLGDTFGMHGTYDLYPETAEYEVFSDDGEGDEEDTAPAAKKAHLSADAFYGDDPADDGEDRGRVHGDSSGRLKGMEGTIKKSIVKNSVTPWNRAGMAGGSSSGAGGKTPHYSSSDKQPKGGLNRAARRAMGGGAAEN